VQYYKVARTDGFDVYTGKTINYRDNVGNTVKVPDAGPPRLCSKTTLHASADPNHGFIGATIPCSIYEVEGEPVVSDEIEDIYGFQELRIVREVPQGDFDELLGWNYTEACNPVHPFRMEAPKITDRHVDLLKRWSEIMDSIWDIGTRKVIWPSLRARWGDPIGDTIGDTNWEFVGYDIKASVENSVRLSIEDSLTAYTGSFFPDTQWLNIEYEPGEYPLQPAADLWREGLVAANDGKGWRLYGGFNAEVLLIEKKFMEKCVVY